MHPFREKLRPFGLHLGASLLLILPFLLVMRQRIYSPEILHIEGGEPILGMILLVALVGGPMLTLFLYRKGKKGLKSDLIIVTLLQLAAFGYGGWTLWSQRPLYLAYIVEHFQIVPASAIDLSTLTVSSLAPHLLQGPQQVFVERPPEGERGDFVFDALYSGRDYHLLPKYYRPFADHLAAMQERGWTLERLREERPQLVPGLEGALRTLGMTESQVLFAPIMGNSGEGTVVLERTTGRILKILDMVIW